VLEIVFAAGREKWIGWLNLGTATFEHGEYLRSRQYT
jgi:hypothetical protein